MKRLLPLLALPFLVSATFPDVPANHMNQAAISYFADEGVIEGYLQSDGTRLFKPDNKVNRAEAIKMVLEGSARNFTVPSSVQETYFNDVASSVWYAPYVVTARLFAIISGDDKTGLFSGSRQVNRAELLKMLTLANSIEVSEKNKSTPTFVAPDVDDSAWYYKYLRYGVAYSIVSPDNTGNVYPAENLTRGQVAQMMYNVLKNVQNGEPQEYLSRIEAMILRAVTLSNTAQLNNASEAIAEAQVLAAEAVSRYGDDYPMMNQVKVITEAYADIVKAHIAKRSGDTKLASTYATSAAQKAASTSGFESLKLKVIELASAFVQ